MVELRKKLGILLVCYWCVIWCALKQTGFQNIVLPLRGEYIYYSQGARLIFTK